MKKINRHQSSKFIANSGLLILFFYILLAIFTFGLIQTSLPGLNVSQLMYIPIIAGFLSIGWAAYNFSFDNIEKWEKGKIIFILILISSFSLILAQVFLIIAGSDTEGLPNYFSLYYFGISLMIISSLLFGVSFFFLRHQLKKLYFKKIIIRYPGFYLIAGFGFQTIAYSLFLISFVVNITDVQGIIDIIGVSIVAASLLLFALGFIQLNISFRAYPHLVEDESIRPK